MNCRPLPRSGQMGLAQAYETGFGALGVRTAQVLLTHADLADRARYLNARSTLLTLLQLGVVPVINENDTVVTDEIKFGDNDTLGALVTNLVDADLLVILTDQAGLFDADPRARPGRTAHRTRPRPAIRGSRHMPAAPAAPIGRGGMLTQGAGRQARGAQRRQRPSSPPGASPTCWCAWRRARRSAPLLVASVPKLAARKQWLADHLQTRGRVVIDAGAAAALCSQGKSLLPIGVVEVQGRFRARRRRRLRGRVRRASWRAASCNYSSAEARLIARRPEHGDRAGARLHRGSRAHPPRQPGAALAPARPGWPGQAPAPPARGGKTKRASSCSAVRTRRA